MLASGFITALVALAVFATVPGAASADVQRNGWGFGIADDDGATFDNPANTPSLGEGFRRLQPRFFRTMLIWNGYEGVPANATQAEKDRFARRARWISRTYSMIDRARTQGAQQIILTLRENDHMDYGSSPDPYIPTAAKYEAEITKIVKNFASRVDVWGAANEPNLWNGPNGNRRLPLPSLISYQAALAKVVNEHDPTAMVTSPDFNDQTPNWLEYVKNYKAAGGGFGNVAAFHPYADAGSGVATRTQSYADVVPAGRNIWLTEVGVRHYGNLAQQQTRVQEMVNPSDGLASVDRVTRIAYYHVRWDGNPDWDSGLLEQNQMPRPAWYAWCAAAHNDNAADPDCTGYPPPPPPSASPAGPAALIAPSNAIHVATVGANQSLNSIVRLSSWQWVAPHSVGGASTTYSKPALALDPHENLFAFAQGPANTLKQTIRYPDGTWGGPYEIGLPGTTYSAPTVTMDAHGNVHVFVQGPGNRLYEFQRYGNWGWHGPYEIAGPGTTYSAPAVVRDPHDNVFVLHQGPGNTMQVTQRYGDWSWHGPFQIGGAGTTFSTPAVIRDPHENLHVFARGPGNTLQEFQRYGNWGWHGPFQIAGGGTTFSAPAALRDPHDNIFVVARGPSDSMQLTQRYGDWSWHGPFQIAGAGTTFSDPAIVRDPHENLHVVAVGPNSTLFESQRHGNWSWHGPFMVAPPGSSY